MLSLNFNGDTFYTMAAPLYLVASRGDVGSPFEVKLFHFVCLKNGAEGVK